MRKSPPPFREEHRRKISEALRGHPKPPRSEEHRRHISESKKGIPLSEAQRRSNEARRGKPATISDEGRRRIGEATRRRKLGVPRPPDVIAKMIATRMARGGYSVSDYTRNAVGAASRNRKRTDEEKQKIASALRGRIRPQEIIEKVRQARLSRRVNPYPPKRIINQQYREWRTAVLRRDNYQCRQCGREHSKNHAHHILGWAHTPEMRFEVENAITLCIHCHARLHHEERRQLKERKC